MFVFRYSQMRLWLVWWKREIPSQECGFHTVLTFHFSFFVPTNLFHCLFSILFSFIPDFSLFLFTHLTLIHSFLLSLILFIFPTIFLFYTSIFCLLMFFHILNCLYFCYSIFILSFMLPIFFIHFYIFPTFCLCSLLSCDSSVFLISLPSDIVSFNLYIYVTFLH